MRRLPLLILTGAFLMPATAAAHPGGERRAETFSGTCALSGTVRHDPPLTSTPQPGQAAARLAGTCTGTLTDTRGRERQLDAAPARYAASATGELSCAGGSSIGRGTLRLGHGSEISFRFTEARGPGAAAISLEGDGGGQASGTAVVSPEEDPQEIARHCTSDGLRDVRVDVSLATPGIAG